MNGNKVIVVGHWEIGYMAPIMESEYWGLVLRDFEVDEWWMTPVSGIKNPNQEVTLHETTDYDAVFAELDPALPRIFFEPRTNHQNPDTTWLHEFDHPTECVYVFGSAHYNPTLQHKRENDMVVTIKTKKDKGVLWSDQCVVLALYDRMVKSWQSQ
jgi:hypothetical protein